MGAAYAAVSSNDRPLLKAHADLSKARDDSSENVEEQEARFTLSLLISEMDKQLLVQSHNTIAKYVYFHLANLVAIKIWNSLVTKTSGFSFSSCAQVNSMAIFLAEKSDLILVLCR